MKKANKVLSLFLALLMFVSVVPFAALPVFAKTESGSCGENVIWSYDNLNQRLTISGSGEMYDYSSKSVPWKDYLKQITSVVINDGVTVIGESAFVGLKQAKSITIADSVKKIRSYAFENCYNLNYLTLPKSIEEISGQLYLEPLSGIKFPLRFDGDINDWIKVKKTSNVLLPFSDFRLLKNGKYVRINDDMISQISEKEITPFTFANLRYIDTLNLPSCVKKIGHCAFYGCENLSKLNLSNEITYIGYYAFAECPSLKECILPDSVTTLSGGTFYKDSHLEKLVIGSGIKELADTSGIDGSFGSCGFAEGCSNLNNIVIPNTVKAISKKAFADCTNLKNLTIENGVESIGEDAFLNCVSLVGSETGLALPDTITQIEGGAFKNCRKLLNVNVPDKIEIIEEETFAGCSSLQNIALPKNLLHIKSQAFQECSSILDVKFPSSLRTIGREAFSDCVSLLNIKLPNNVESIGAFVFDNCEKLENVTLNEGLVTMGEGAFENCASLQEMIFPNSLTNVGGNICKNNTSLKRVKFGTGMTALNPVGITTGFFENCTSLDNVVVLKNIKTIGEGAFKGCSALKNITLEQGVEIIDNEAFQGCTSLAKISIPQGVKSVGNSAFSDCSGLENLFLNEDLNKIGDYAFRNCSKLNDFNIPEKTLDIGKNILDNSKYYNNIACWDGNALYKNKVLTYLKESDISNYKVKDGTLAVASQTFKDSTSLTNIEFPASVLQINKDVLPNCDTFNSITINGPTLCCDGSLAAPANINSIIINNAHTILQDQPFYNTEVHDYKVPITVKGWSNVNFENGIITAGDTGIDLNKYSNDPQNTITKTIVFEEGVKVIGDRRLKDRLNIESVFFPNSLERIGDYFMTGESDKCKNIVFPNTVKSIGTHAFNGRTFESMVCSIPDEYKKRFSKELSRVTDENFFFNTKQIPDTSITCRNFSNTVFIGNNVNQIYSSAFSKPDNLTLISLNKNFQYHGFRDNPTQQTAVAYIYKDSVQNLKYNELTAQAGVSQYIKYLYDVIYHTDGGEFVDSDFFPEKVYVDKEEIDLSPNVSKAGKIFVGWSNEPNGELVDSIKATKNTDLYAVYKDAKYSISFDANGGEGTTPGMGSDTKENIKLLKNGFYKKGYTFLGWSKDKNAKTPDFLDGAVCSPFGLLQRKVTLYAIWEENKAPVVEEKPVAPEVITINKTYDDKHPENEPEPTENEGDDSADADLDIEQIKKVPKTGDDMYLITIIFGLAGVSLVGAANVLIITSYRKKKNKR